MVNFRPKISLSLKNIWSCFKVATFCACVWQNR